MDPIQQHLISKLLADRAQQQQQDQTPFQAPPPPYGDSENDSEAEDDDDNDDDDEQDNSTSPPLKLTINAAQTVHGSGNLVPTSPNATTDATKLSIVILNAIDKLNAGQSKHTLNVNLTINCGINIVGNRNVVGNIALRPKSPMALQGLNIPTGNVAAGAKRKVDVDEVSYSPPLFYTIMFELTPILQDKVGDEPGPKRIAIKRE